MLPILASHEIVISNEVSAMLRQTVLVPAAACCGRRSACWCWWTSWRAPASSTVTCSEDPWAPGGCWGYPEHLQAVVAASFSCIRSIICEALRRGKYWITPAVAFVLCTLLMWLMCLHLLGFIMKPETAFEDNFVKSPTTIIYCL